MSSKQQRFEYTIGGNSKKFFEVEFASTQNGLMMLHNHTSRVKILISIFNGKKYELPINSGIIPIKTGYKKFVMVLDNRSQYDKDGDITFLLYTGDIKINQINNFEIPDDSKEKNTRNDPKYNFGSKIGGDNTI
jgi:hypothetical protein